MTDDTRWNASVLPAAPLPAALKTRLHAVMHAARAEAQQDEEWEKWLAEQLVPAPLSPSLRSRLGHRVSAASRRFRPWGVFSSYGWRREGAIAASVAVLVGAGGWFLSDLFGVNGGENVPAYTSRSVIESRGSDEVQWQDGLIPIHRYEVTYEDSFVLPGDDDTTLVIRVPNRTTIRVRGDII